MTENTRELSEPFLGYFHFYPPHGPYATRKEFFNIYMDDDFAPIEKPPHLFSKPKTQQALDNWRSKYDESIRYMDAEIGRLLMIWKRRGSLKTPGWW